MSYRQAIPRPDDASVVEPAAAFVHHQAELSAALTSWHSVELALGRAGAGATGARPGVHDRVPSVAPSGGGARPSAAVLVPLIMRSQPSGTAARKNVLDVVLIRRAMHLLSNPGEIAFPGGRIEPDETPADAAVREAFEEIALPPSSVRLIGELPPVGRASRPEAIASFVAAVEGVPQLSANPTEVDELLLVPLAELADPSRYWEETWIRGEGLEWRMHFFHMGGDLLWGMSARILVSLFDLLVAGGQPSPGGTRAAR